jgi:actin-related protein
MDGDKPAIVIDNGSYSSKVGFVGDFSPRKIFRTVVGCPLEEELEAGTARGTDNPYIGDEALKRRDFLYLRFPVERGIITNWDGIEQV